MDDYSEFLLNSQADEMLRDPRFDAGKPTLFYFHGYTENPEKESVHTVISGERDM